MPTAIDVLDRIKTERKAKFAQEVQPMREYIGQLQALKSQQRQRAEAKEDYVWEAEQNTKIAEERRATESKRLGEVAKKYYAGNNFRDLLSRGEANLEDLDKIREMGQNDTFKQAQSSLSKIKATIPAEIATQLKTQYPDIDNESLNLLTESKRQQNYDVAYKRAIGAEDSLKEAESAYIDGVIDYSQYSQMVSDISNQNKSQAEIDLANAKVGTELAKTSEGGQSFSQILTSPEYKAYVDAGIGNEEKVARAYEVMNKNGITPDTAQQKSMYKALKLSEPDDLYKDVIVAKPVMLKTQIHAPYEDKIGVNVRQGQYQLLRKAELAMNEVTDINPISMLASPSDIAALEEIRKKGSTQKDGTNNNKIFTRYAIDYHTTVNDQVITKEMLEGLFTELGLDKPTPGVIYEEAGE